MAHGGARPGAGRPRGRGKFGEETRTIRIPVSRVSDVMRLVQDEATGYQIPLYGGSVRAGFPSPSDDYIESTLDLNEHLIKHPSATFLVRASGESMIHAGIFSGDILVVDRSIEPVHGKIVVAALNGELTVKRLSLRDGCTRLLAENPDFPPIDITDEYEMIIWGVVAHVIHSVG